jgi:hypothetical protein
MGIPTLAHMINEGRFSIPYAHAQDRDAWEDFCKALILWPKKPNDIPMSLWLAELSMRDLLYEMEHLGPLVTDDYYQMSDHLQAQVYDVDMGSFGSPSPRLDVW